MRVPQVSERIKEAPAQALRGVFAGIGQLLLITDKLRNKASHQDVPRAGRPERRDRDDTTVTSPADQGAGTAAAAAPAATAPAAAGPAEPTAAKPPTPGGPPPSGDRQARHREAPAKPATAKPATPRRTAAKAAG